MSDFDNYLRAKARTELHQADFKRARAELRLAQIEERVEMLLSQAEPNNSLGIDRAAPARSWSLYLAETKPN